MTRWILAVMAVLFLVVLLLPLGGCSMAPANPIGAATSPTEHTPTTYVMVCPTVANGQGSPWLEQSGKAKSGDRNASASGDTSADASATTSTDVDATAEVLPPPSP